MAKESVSKLVSKGAKVTKGVVTGVAKGATGVAKTASKAAVVVEFALPTFFVQSYRLRRFHSFHLLHRNLYFENF